MKSSSKFGRLLFLIIILVSVYFYRDLIIVKIRPYIIKIPLTEKAQKLVGLDDINSTDTKSKILNAKKEVSLPGPLEQIFNQSIQINKSLVYKKIIDETNSERIKYNLKPLSEKNILNSSAVFKSYDMNTNQYFEHESPTGVDIADLASQFGYEYITIGENLAMGNFQSEAEIVSAWMNSPGHKANILNPKYTQIGVGLVPGSWQGKQVWYAVQHFGKPLTDCPSVDKNLKSIVDKNQLEISAIKKTLSEQKIMIDKVGNTAKDYPSLINSYNELVNKYNALISDTKSKINTYNMQVKAFNTCSQ